MGSSSGAARAGLALDALPTWAGSLANVVIETPKNTPNKLKFDPGLGAMRLTRVLPAGMVFPFDFGFLPGTAAPDGDPLDVLVLMDAPVYPGCVVATRLVGVLRCEQSDEPGQTFRNDRLIGVADEAKTYDARTLRDLDRQLLDQIEAFFVDEDRVVGRGFRVLKRKGRKAALRTARAAVRQARVTGR